MSTVVALFLSNVNIFSGTIQQRLETESDRFDGVNTPEADRDRRLNLQKISTGSSGPSIHINIIWVFLCCKVYFHVIT